MEAASEANFVQSESGGQDSEGRVGGQVPLGRGSELTGRRKVWGMDVSYFYWYSQSPLNPYFHHQILVSVPILLKKKCIYLTCLFESGCKQGLYVAKSLLIYRDSLHLSVSLFLSCYCCCF